MLKSFFEKYSKPEPVPLTADDFRLALTVLLVRVARADRDYSKEEKQHISELISGCFQITINEANELRLEAEDLEGRTQDSVQFTRIIKQKIPFDQREEILEILWEIVLSDGERSYGEDGFLRLITNLLGVTDRDSALARQRAMERMGKN
ncbi:MAG: TerB family tellurite resistance protein [Paracoccaceae bacterium]|nr:TerB family tellurite resistance protein [Paracoccaceae bacterium]MDE2916085.1 TerB family tellurite resistance protein [Paracoccaceae bacterium]